MHAPELRNVRILADLNNSQLDDLLNYGKVLHLREGEIVIQQGTAADAMFLLLKGKLGTYVTDAAGNETHLRTIETGGHFGEIGLLQSGIRTATIRTLSPSMIFRLDPGSFNELLKVPELAVPFLHGLSRSLAIRLADITSRFANSRAFKEAWTI